MHDFSSALKERGKAFHFKLIIKTAVVVVVCSVFSVVQVMWFGFGRESIYPSPTLLTLWLVSEISADQCCQEEEERRGWEITVVWSSTQLWSCCDHRTLLEDHYLPAQSVLIGQRAPGSVSRQQQSQSCAVIVISQSVKLTAERVKREWKEREVVVVSIVNHWHYHHRHHQHQESREKKWKKRCINLAGKLNRQHLR